MTWPPELEPPVAVLLVDDGSSEAAPPLVEPTLRHIARVDVLHLRRNVGHRPSRWDWPTCTIRVRTG